MTLPANVNCLQSSIIDSCKTVTSNIGENIPRSQPAFRNTRCEIWCEICSKLSIKTPEQHPRRRSCVFIVNFEHISRLVLVFLLLTLNM